MRIIKIFKAQRLSPSSPEIESVTINIHAELPAQVTANLAEWRAIAMKEAMQIENALASTLPQAVLDALVARLLERSRSLYVRAAAQPGD